MRGVLQSVSGGQRDPILRAPGILGGQVRLDGRVEVTLVLDSPTVMELDALQADVGRGFYHVVRDDGTTAVVRP